MKTALVFGASQGIGFSIARELAQQGYVLAMLARRESVLQQAVTAVAEESEQAVYGVAVDVLDETLLQQKVETLLNSINSIDLVINCVGQARPDYFEHISATQFEATLRLNVVGARNIAQATLPHLKKVRGHLINTASVAGFVGVFGYTDYAASKFAVVGFSQALQREVEKAGVGVSVLYPPDTDTEGFAREEVAKPWETRAVSASGKLVPPEVVAKAVIKALPRRKRHILPTLEVRCAFYLQRLFPQLLEWVMRRSIRLRADSS